MRYEKKFFILKFVIISFIGYGQEIKGIIFDSNKDPIFGASVYFNGTSIGTISRDDGSFSIGTPSDNSIPLIISFLGFETVFITNYSFLTEPLKIQLNESNQELDEVIIETDTWSREKKLREFREVFLGTTSPALECKILNEDAIKLTYKPSQGILIAYANEPLVIKNKFLGYVVNYNLQNFKIQYETPPNGFQFITSTYYDGFTFFEELKKSTSKKHTDNRKLSYEGSLLHFFRSIYKKELIENKFKIYENRKEVLPYSKIKVSMENDLATVELLSKDLIIMFNNSLQSTLISKEIFYIDKYGNHSPPDAITVGGNLAIRKLAFLLPLEYGL
ncbi:carboxypeptidase-like regulatory domain-containing protein [Confluentibacter sediminis]|uniref:carboxypeptidase-like regulatory domain-containing protein n=1 Tax=Confluentibacter sediminis TaxID=2219045 RepID=UPI0013A7046A|nr:carboxypeptidase-like regulatory domain-containing protein [Confluentibacter sediminis]